MRRQQRLGHKRGDPVAWGDWLVGAQICATDGTPTGKVSWGTTTLVFPTGAGVNVPLGALGILLVQEPSLAPSVSPTINELQIAEVMGSIFIDPGNTGSPNIQVNVAVGIYVSEYNSNTSKWLMKDPLSPVDAQDDDWLYLRGQYEISPDSAVVLNAADKMMEFRLGLPKPEILAHGEALMLVVNVGVTSGAKFCSVQSYVRSRIARAA